MIRLLRLGRMHYLITVDRFTGWLDVWRAKPQSTEAGAAGLINMCREMFICFRIPVELASDGGQEYASGAFRDFLQRWGVCYQILAAYYTQSNGRAEVAVKAAKWAMRDNTGVYGEMDSDKFARALLQLRNTPTALTGKASERYPNNVIPAHRAGDQQRIRCQQQ